MGFYGIALYFCCVLVSLLSVATVSHFCCLVCVLKVTSLLPFVTTRKPSSVTLRTLRSTVTALPATQNLPSFGLVWPTVILASRWMPRSVRSFFFFFSFSSSLLRMCGQFASYVYRRSVTLGSYIASGAHNILRLTVHMGYPKLSSCMNCRC